MSIEIMDRDKRLKEGLRADILRKSFETKGLLSQKGDIYVGTGEHVTIQSKEGEIVIPETRRLSAGADGKVLVLKEINGNIDVTYDYVPPELIPSGSCDIYVNHAINSDSCTEATAAECAEFALPPSTEPEGTRTLPLSLLITKNHIDFPDTGEIPLRIKNTALNIGIVQVKGAYCEGNFLVLPLTILLYGGDERPTGIEKLFVDGEPADSDTPIFSRTDFFVAKGEVVAEGSFPSVVLKLNDRYYSKAQSVPIQYTLNNNGYFSISVDALSFSPRISAINRRITNLTLYIDLVDRD
jgi:hypothetical protein